MSLEVLITEAARALSDARKLFGPSPVNGRWPSPQFLVDGRQAVAEAGRAAASSWRGQAETAYRSGSSKQLQWLDNTITADTRIASPFANAGQGVMEGAQNMDGLIAETRSGVNALAPRARTTAGQRELATYLEGQVNRAKDLVQTFQERSTDLAARIDAAALGYHADRPGTPQIALKPHQGYIIWCTPSTTVDGYICEFLQDDGSIIWRHSPIDITGGMP
ncbi:DUF4226 domain-containing protein [Mycobacterium sp. 050128]|uniref:DUF4226 domain-containing protein n=1 Tax=Mycobacterium sp. 050128 TaxID=3096112 RepID=UPI002EDB78AA